MRFDHWDSLSRDQFRLSIASLVEHAGISLMVLLIEMISPNIR